MRRTSHLNAFVAIVGVGLFGCSAGLDKPESTGETTADRAADELSMIPQHPHSAVCQGGKFQCKARVRSDGITGAATAVATPAGLGAGDLASAYKLNTSATPGATIAIVDAYGYAAAESDLATYRKQYGLPPCTVASGCLKIVTQSGATTPLPKAPPTNDDWTLETALDLDMASAACPNCKLLLVQANDDTSNGLYLAQAAAVKLGATVISNSWGSPESASSPGSSFESYFDFPGVSIFVAAGDSGYDDGGQGPDYPSVSAHVIAVGGTSLAKSTSAARGWVEGAWSTSSGQGAGGSSCSTSIAKPSWQSSVVSSAACKYRAAADVAAVGDPNTGPAIYNAKNGGWVVIGGTSAAAPFVAGVFALTGHGAKNDASFVYGAPSSFYDVTSGSNGSCGTLLCNAGAGWDGPTGLGSPNGAALAGTTCVPSCSGKTCGANGCGGSCGACASGSSCSAAGQCVSNACVPSCSGKACGSDGCGGTCGTCAGGTTCNTAGACVAACTPSCAGKTCGSDGCGGTCGTCGAGTSCSAAGQCAAANTCTHALCTAGRSLKSTCDACVKKICAADAYCCSNAWDSVCVGEVASVCGEAC